MASRELDLHQLYCNVTSLGGCARVTAEKKWRARARPKPLEATAKLKSKMDFELMHPHTMVTASPMCS